MKKLLSLILALSLISGAGFAFAEEPVSDRKVIASDDFSSGGSKWSIDSSTDVYVLDEHLVFNKSKTSHYEATAFAKSISFDNAEFSFDLRIARGNTFSTIFRKKDDANYYQLNTTSAGRFTLQKKVAGGAIKTIASGEGVMSSDKASSIHITLLGSSIKVHCDSALVIDFSDYGIASGTIGFNGNDTLSYVDNVLVYKYTNTEYNIEVVDPNAKAHVQLYVAKDGSDGNGDGSINNPYATIEKAKSEARFAKVGKTPVDIVIRGGEYFVSDTIELTKDDGGKDGAPITYKAYEGENVTFTSAKDINLSAFKPLDEGLKYRVKDDAKDKILQVDLRSQGFKREDVDYAAGLAYNSNRKPPIILFNNSRQSISRWPNTMYEMIEELEDGDKTQKSTIYYKSSEPLRWGEARDMFIEGWLAYDWHGEWVKIESIDTKKSAIHLATPTQYGVRTGHRWAVVNLLEEIDIPGEWYIDPDKMILYYYPQRDFVEGDRMQMTAVRKNMLNIVGASYVNIENINFTMNGCDFLTFDRSDTGGNGISIMGGSSFVNVKNCSITHIGIDGIHLVNANNVTIDNCVITDAGLNGIYLSKCGVRDSITPSNIVIKNCDISAANRDTGRNAHGGISTDNDVVGVSILNNVIHDCPNQGIRYDGIGNDIGYNEIYRCLLVTADAGAIYSGRSWASYGTVIHHNYFHDNATIIRQGGDHYQDATVFWDDNISGQEMSYNISVMNNYDATCGVQVGGGFDCVVHANTFVNAEKAIQGDDRSSSYNYDWKERATSYFRYGTRPTTNTHLYPKMYTIFDRFDARGGAYKIENELTDNISVNNTIHNKISTAMYNDSVVTGNVDINDEEENIFVDPLHQDYRVKKSAKAKYGISSDILDEDFDLDLIGTQREHIVRDEDVAVELTYPADGATEISPKTGEIAWSRAPMADVYDYEIATDPDFNNIVMSGTTPYQSVYFDSSIKKSTTYYWRVASHNDSRQGGKRLYATNGTRSFTTASVVQLETAGLTTAIETAADFVKTIKEGTKIGEYKPGTTTNIKSQIDKAKASVTSTTLEQEDIDQIASDLITTVNKAEANINAGYTTLDLSDNSLWKSNNTATFVDTRDNTASIYVNGGSEVTLKKIIPNYNVMCFRTQIANFNDNAWFAYGLRAQTTESAIYAQDAYYILMKKDIFELQKHGKIYQTCANNGKFKEGEWNDIKFGSITTKNGINMYFELNGEVIFDYLDKNEPQYKPGYFAIYANSPSNQVDIQCATDIPTGLYEMSDKIKKEIDHKVEDGSELAVDDSNYVEAGSGWGLINGKWGPDNSAIRQTNAKSASAKWIMNSGKAGNNCIYKVSYYHIPDENGDKNVNVLLSGYGGNYETTIDLSQGEEGYVELGTFRLASEGYIGLLSITFTASGEGNLNLSNVKFERVEGASDMLK